MDAFEIGESKFNGWNHDSVTELNLFLSLPRGFDIVSFTKAHLVKAVAAAIVDEGHPFFSKIKIVVFP